MATRISWLWLLFLPFIAPGCNGCNGDTKGADAQSLDGEFEGDAAGECSDGADNDRDGYFDCQDNGCWGSPDCEGVDGNGTATGNGGPGTGGGNGTGTGTGTATGGGPCVHPLCDLTSMEMSLRMEFDMGLIEALGICDCYIELEGFGDFVAYDATEDRVEFFGEWNRVDPGPGGGGTTGGTGVTAPFFEGCDPKVEWVPCDSFISDGVWYEDGPAYHSFFFDALSPPTLNIHWITYEFPGGFVPQKNPLAAHQFFVTDIWTEYDHDLADPVVSEVIQEADPGGQFDVEIFYDATFHK